MDCEKGLKEGRKEERKIGMKERRGKGGRNEGRKIGMKERKGKGGRKGCKKKGRREGLKEEKEGPRKKVRRTHILEGFMVLYDVQNASLKPLSGRKEGRKIGGKEG